MKPRIAIWAAVSTPEQATVDKDSLPGQVRDGREWADGVGDVVAVYEVPGHTRQYIHFHEAAEEMDAYRDLERDAANKAFDVLWCRERSRLGRTRALIHTVEAVVSQSGAEVYSAKTPHVIGTSSKSHRSLISSFEAWQAEDEITQLQKYHKAGMRARAQRGLPRGMWPYGYAPVRDANGRIVGGKFIPAEIEAIEKITAMFLGGYSFAVIADALNSNLTCPPRRAARWERTVIQRIVNNDFYAGFTAYNDAINQEPSDKYPVLWDERTHAQIIQERIRRKPGGSKRSSVLSGCMWCIRCGKTMRINRAKPGLVYFRCATHSDRSITGIDCHTNYVPEGVAIEVAEVALERVREMNRDELLEMLGTGDVERDELLRSGERVERAIDDDYAALDRLAQFVAAGALTLAACAAENERIAARLAAHQKQLGEIAHALAQMPSSDERLAMLLEVVDLPIDLTMVDPDEARLMLQRARLKIWCEEGQIKRVEIG
jgi:DNA invertase Pin-like site-specific DNA recombinase